MENGDKVGRSGLSTGAASIIKEGRESEEESGVSRIESGTSANEAKADSNITDIAIRFRRMTNCVVDNDINVCDLMNVISNRKYSNKIFRWPLAYGFFQKFPGQNVPLGQREEGSKSGNL